MKRSALLTVVVFFALQFIAVQRSAAAPMGPPKPPMGPPCWPPPCVPIDGGVSLLIAAGAVYGGKKLYDSRKNKTAE
ncbi:MAG: PID-CTERM protein-sorting domain-containing protein [Bacteroidota bacterium]